MTKVKVLNALFILLCLMALPIAADELVAPTFKPQIVIANEIVVRDVEGEFVNSFLTSTVPSNPTTSSDTSQVTNSGGTSPPPKKESPKIFGANVATGDLDGDGTQEIVVGMANNRGKNGDKVEIYTLNGVLLNKNVSDNSKLSQQNYL